MPTRKNKKVVRLRKDELAGTIMAEFTALKPNTYVYQIDDDSEVKKAKGTKKWVIKRPLKFNDYKDYLLNNKVVFE